MGSATHFTTSAAQNMAMQSGAIGSDSTASTVSACGGGDGGGGNRGGGEGNGGGDGGG